MFTDAKYPVTLFIASLIVLMIGLYFKVMNIPGAQLIIGSMLIVQVLSILWLVVIIFRSGNNK